MSCDDAIVMPELAGLALEKIFTQGPKVIPQRQKSPRLHVYKKSENVTACKHNMLLIMSFESFKND